MLEVLNLDSENCCHKLRTDMSCSCFGTSGGNRNKANHYASRDAEGMVLGKTKSFLFNELTTATNNFHQSNKIGRGGFGTVYKGKLKNGTPVAVKTLSAFSKQGLREFLTEIDTISNVRHPNLVQLIGCCVHGSNRILVYEYLENNSLDRALLGIWRFLEELGFDSYHNDPQ